MFHHVVINRICEKFYCNKTSKPQNDVDYAGNISLSQVLGSEYSRVTAATIRTETKEFMAAGIFC